MVPILQVVALRPTVQWRTGVNGKALSRKELVLSKNEQEDIACLSITNRTSMSVPVYLKSAQKPMSRRVLCVSHENGNSLKIYFIVKFQVFLTIS